MDGQVQVGSGRCVLGLSCTRCLVAGVGLGRVAVSHLAEASVDPAALRRSSSIVVR